MKNTLLVLLALGLIQGSFVFAEEGGHERGGGRDNGGRNDGGFSNSDSPRVERDQSAGNPETKITQPKKRRSPRLNQNVPHSANGGHFANGASSLKSPNHSSLVSGGNPRNGGVAGAGNPRNNRTAFVSPKVRAMGFTHVPAPIRDRSKILTVGRARSVMTLPKVGMGGATIGAKVIGPRAIGGRVVVSHMTSITRNAAFASQINIYNRSELVRNNYYWHTGNGFNYCHYYDNWGYHWYGWYFGSSFFWTRYYCDNWWWYDNAFDRWCYWHDGGWWWQDPSLNVVYVYNNGAYTQAETSAPSNSNNSNQVVYQSNDGTRKVKIMGGGDAFLYDATDSPSFDPVYLASGVKDVKFSDTSGNKPLQIILTLNDGTFQMFDSNGSAYGQSGGSASN